MLTFVLPLTSTKLEKYGNEEGRKKRGREGGPEVGGLGDDFQASGVEEGTASP